MKDISGLPLFTEIDEAVFHAQVQTQKSIEDLRDKFKPSASTGNFYPQSENDEWTNGMWTGEINIMYELTHQKSFKEKALEHVGAFKYRIDEMVAIHNHDMGFLYCPSCVAGYRLYQSEDGKTSALKAADYLISRFQEKGQFIQAWGPVGERKNYRLIIDCLMNIPLLFWASSVSGDDRYEKVALAHFNTSIECVLRPDDSTYHTYFFDPDTGAPLYGVTHQGNRNDSAWARGQAWGIYGSALAYRYTREEKAKNVFDRTLAYFLSHLPESVIPYWDFDFDDPSDEPRDSSALAIAICGMYEMSDLIGDVKLRDVADRLLGVLYRKCAVKDPALSNGQLLHGVYCKKTPTNDARDRGVDECNTWGDYFYVEALMRSKNPGWQAYW